MKRKVLLVTMILAMMAGSITGCGNASNLETVNSSVTEFVSEQFAELEDEEASEPEDAVSVKPSSAKREKAAEVIAIESEEKTDVAPAIEIVKESMEQESKTDASDKTSEEKKNEDKQSQKPASEKKQAATQPVSNPSGETTQNNMNTTTTCPDADPVYEDWYVAGGVFEREVMPAGHDFVVTDTFVVNHCCFDATTYTTTYYTCSRCGREFSYSVDSPFTAFDECNIVWTENNHNCDEYHYKIKSCTVHNGWHSDPIIVPASEHDIYVEETERNECEGTVTEYYSCRKCTNWKRYKIVETFSAPGHKDLNWDSICDACGVATKAGKHNCSDYPVVDFVIEQPSCEATGYGASGCEFCKTPILGSDRTIPELGHDFVTIEETDDEGCSYKYTRCSRCGSFE